MRISYLGHTLSINGKEIVLPHKVAQVVSIGEIVVVRVSADGTLPLNDRSLNSNVFAFDGHANMLWKIQEASHGGNPRSKSYTNIREENQRLVAGNWIGVDYVVDLADGTVQPIGSGQRPW